MFIETDKNNRIVSAVYTGGVKTDNNIEIQLSDIDETILKDIFNYLYIDGKFVLDPELGERELKIHKESRIKQLSEVCNKTIENGLIIDGLKYSLTPTDQMNIMNLYNSMKLNNLQYVMYHADGQPCKSYTAEEFYHIYDITTDFIISNTTYYNILKIFINTLQSIVEVDNMKYGMGFPVTFAKMLSEEMNIDSNTIDIAFSAPIKYNLSSVDYKYDEDEIFDGFINYDDIMLEQLEAAQLAMLEHAHDKEIYSDDIDYGPFYGDEFFDDGEDDLYNV